MDPFIPGDMHDVFLGSFSEYTLRHFSKCQGRLRTEINIINEKIHIRDIKYNKVAKRNPRF